MRNGKIFYFTRSFVFVLGYGILSLQVRPTQINIKEAKTMKAETKYVVYEPGEYYLTQGHKGYERKHRNKKGQYVTPTGFGWGTVSKPSKITVGIEVSGKRETVLVDRYFKNNWGRMTAGRVRAIQETLPNELELVENQTYAGEVYYTVADESMDSWLAAAKEAR